MIKDSFSIHPITHFFDRVGATISVAAVLLVTTLLGGCASPRINTPGDVQLNTQLALSPNGNRLLVSWHDRDAILHAKLVELNGSEVASIRKMELPQNTFTTAFANNNAQLLYTTKDGASSSLLKMDLEKNTQELIYKSQFIMRFPLEVSNGNFVFLEGIDAESRVNRWHRYQNGIKSVLNKKGYGIAARLNVVGDALFILEPWTPPAFRNIHGALPVGLSSLIETDTFAIECADLTPLTCLRSRSFIEPNGSQYVSSIAIISGSRQCKVAGYRKTSAEETISRDGSTVVFHAALGEWDGPRALYFVKNTNGICQLNTISIKEE